MHRERDHEIAISPGAERSAAPAACALRGGALKRGRALPEGDPILLKLGGRTLRHDANNREPPLGEPSSLGSNLSRKVDRETTAESGADRSQVGPGAQMMGVGPSGLQMGRGIGQHPQQIPPDHATIVPEIPGHVVAEAGARLQVADGRDKVNLWQAPSPGRNGIPMHPCVVTGFRIATPFPCQGTGWGTAGAGRCADRDRASLVVAAAQRKCSVHRLLSAK